MIVCTGLPLDLADLGISHVVRERVAHEPPDGGDASAAEVAIRDEAAPAREGGEAQRAVLDDGDRTRRFRVGAKLLVIGSKESRRIHRCHGAAPRTWRQLDIHAASSPWVCAPCMCRSRACLPALLIVGACPKPRSDALSYGCHAAAVCADRVAANHTDDTG